jgi:hypothetical protein
MVLGMGLLGQRKNFACRLLGRGYNHHAKVLCCTPRQTEAQLVSKCQGKLLKGILFLQDNASPHKAAMTHQKLADLHFEVLKHAAFLPDLVLSDYCLLPNLKGRKFSSIEGATLAIDMWFVAQSR